MQNAQPAISFLYGIKRPQRVDTWNEEWDIHGNNAIMSPMGWKITAYCNLKKVGKLEHMGQGKDLKIIVRDDVSPCTKEQVMNALKQEYFGKKG